MRDRLRRLETWKQREGEIRQMENRSGRAKPSHFNGGWLSKTQASDEKSLDALLVESRRWLTDIPFKREGACKEKK